MTRLPQPPTRFVGREADLTRLIKSLNATDCRLLTLVGVGGIGKTRLAIQAGRQYAQTNSKAVHFVNLQPIHSTEQLPSAIADSVGVTLSGNTPLTEQLHQHCSERDGLIILDNFEQLLDGDEQALAVQFVTNLLHATDKLKLLITSREPLELVEEWLYPVNGLLYTGEKQAEAAPSEAAQLFIRSAQRVRPQFNAAEESADIDTLCTLVDGMPLALELAATWTKSLSVAEIVEELNESNELLSTNLHNLPVRHRSVETVIDQTWSRLSEREQEAFAKLSVFEGGFQRRAATKVAGASLPLLATLLDKSLLRYERDKRYQIHELLRQYAERQLDANATATRKKHASFYAATAAKWHDDLFIAESITQEEMRRELDNFRAAWRWVSAHGPIAEWFDLAIAFSTYLSSRNLNLEYVEVLEHAVDQIKRHPQNDECEALRAYLLNRLGHGYVRLGRIPDAAAVLGDSLALYEDGRFAYPKGLATDPILFLSIVAWMGSDFELAVERAEKGLANAKAQNHLRNWAYALSMMSGALSALGKHDEAEPHAREALAIVERINARDHLAFAHTELSKLDMARQNYLSAEKHIRAAITARQETRQVNGEAMALNALAYCKVSQNQYGAAKEAFEHALQLHRTTQDGIGAQSCLNGLGMVALAEDDYEGARGYYAEGLAIGLEQDIVAYTAGSLVGIGELLLKAGQADRGKWLLLSLAEIDAVSPGLSKRVRLLLPKKAIALWPLATDILTLGTQIRSEIGHLDLTKRTVSAETKRQGSDSKELVEQLTAREIEILERVCKGMTNRAIAEELILSIGTVKWYTQQIYGKLGVKNRTQAMIRANQLNLVSKNS